MKSVAVERSEELLPLRIEIPDIYWQVYDPFNEEDDDKLVCGMIFDDLNDIYSDLMEGVIEYEMGEICDVCSLYGYRFYMFFGYLLGNLG